MAGSHSAKRKKAPVASPSRAKRRQPPPRLSRRTVAAAVAIAILPALWLGTQRLLDSDETGEVRGTVPIPDVTSTRTPSRAPSSPAVSSPAVSSLTPVAPSGPRQLIVKDLLDVGFDDSIEAESGGFQAASTAEAARWGSRGLPSSPGTDTVFLVGKVYRNGASAFDDLPEVKVGATITLRTQSGAALDYTVQSSGNRPAAGLLSTPEFADKVPGRLVLVGILYDADDDQRTGQYLVTVAQLSSARA